MLMTLSYLVIYIYTPSLCCVCCIETPSIGLRPSFDAGKFYRPSVFSDEICHKGSEGKRAFFIVEEGSEIKIPFNRYIKEKVSLSILNNCMEGYMYVFEWCHCRHASIQRD
jgi:hypothetical protein